MTVFGDGALNEVIRVGPKPAGLVSLEEEVSGMGEQRDKPRREAAEETSPTDALTLGFQPPDREE